MSGYSSSASSRGLAVSRCVADVVASWDEGQYRLFKEAVAYALDVISTPRYGMFDAVPLLVIYDGIGLILRFDGNSERYFVTAVITDDGFSPDPGGMHLFVLDPDRSLIEDSLNALGLPASIARKSKRIRIVDLIDCKDPISLSRNMQSCKKKTFTSSDAKAYSSPGCIQEGKPVRGVASAKRDVALCGAYVVAFEFKPVPRRSAVDAPK